ncbi:MAG: alkaline phosphatase family protein [Bacteroidota bacterium]|nr:alkaline phosphatase family protein [Bacteroidota bacterium]
MKKITIIILCLTFSISTVYTQEMPKEIKDAVSWLKKQAKSTNTFGGKSTNTLTKKNEPKLIVGIVVDQMRYDYIDRFWDDFGKDGLKRLIKEGFSFGNANFSYTPTFTGPGHASIYTGTTPSVHGIIANNWYDKYNKKYIYCTGDATVETICNCENLSTDVIAEDGKMSPRHMLTTTISDEMKLFNEDAKTIAISLKDRGAILPAGHSATAAYWMDQDGRWISSSYYMDVLPEWLIQFQEKNPAENYLTGEWEIEGGNSHNLDNMLKSKGPSAIKNTPYGNTILNELGIEIIKQEALGQSNSTDFLSISFSSTDYIGHQYGPHAKEIKDTYISLDKDIAKLLKTISENVGSKNVIVFLTADHGVVSEPKKLIERKIPAGYWDKDNCNTQLKNHLNKKYGDGEWVKSFSNNQIFLNHDLIISKNMNIRSIQESCARFLINIEGIKNTYTATQMHEHEYRYGFRSLIQKGYSQKRSGDVLIALETGWISKGWEKGGTTHGTAYSYDTHVPLIFWGRNIKHGKSNKLTHIQDIAPTISTILGISFPNGCTGSPIIEITE